MREFRSLQPQVVSEAFDAEIHGEEPIVELLDGPKGHILISYTFPGFYLSEDTLTVEDKEVSFKQVNIAATGFLAESGKPLLPSFGRYVQIPFNCDFTFTVKKGKPTQFDDILVSPAQENVTDNPEAEHELEYNAAFYEKDEYYPVEVVKIAGPFTIDDYQALLVHVCPFQFNPRKKKLIGYGNITVDIAVLPKESESDTYPYSDTSLNKEAYGNFFVNPSRKVEARLPAAMGRVDFPSIRPRGPEFLIIYYEGFKKAAEQLSKWKRQCGLRTEIVSIDDIGNSVAEIKKYIRNGRRYAFSRLRYVLFLGDVDMIVSEDIHDNKTDYYYSTSRDPQGDEYLLPWLATGRIPVRTLTEAMDVVSQIISYEKTPPTDPDYYKRMVFAAFFQDDNGDNQADMYRFYMKTMEAIREQMITLGFNVGRVYVTNSPNPQFYADGTPVPADVVASMVDPSVATDILVDATSEGQLIIGHRDHGSTDGWVHPSFGKHHLDSVTGKVPTPFYSLNCSTGKFDLIPVSTECFGEKILRIKGAAPSLIAPTRDSNTFLNNDMMKALFDATWGGVLPTFPGATASYPIRHNRLGDILNYAKTYLPLRTSAYSTVTSTTVQDHFEIFHVLGDPTLQLWKAKPRRAMIQAWVKGRFLNIQLYRCLKDSVITIWYGEKMIKRLEPSSTYMKMALPETIPSFWAPQPSLLRKFSICFWAPGYRFRQIVPTIKG
jgi:hypothetical protein